MRLWPRRGPLEHRWTQRHLSDYIDRDLNERARRRLEAHAAECDDCRRTLGTLSTLVRMLRRLPSRADEYLVVGERVVVRLRDEWPCGHR
ncbi:MAG TPA: zf-HC2 domain-containing protein [Solirubrobacteraceae bacterium]